MHIHGIVRVEAVVKANGTVKSTRVLGGNPVLVDAAIEAVGKWKFEPAPKRDDRDRPANVRRSVKRAGLSRRTQVTGIADMSSPPKGPEAETDRRQRRYPRSGQSFRSAYSLSERRSGMTRTAEICRKLASGYCRGGTHSGRVVSLAFRLPDAQLGHWRSCATAWISLWV